ncbi:polysaccharide pyruvyl transferase family protein [Aidingimonas halophila]|uniref:Polysaccharide pyruvyl transferase family protein WcaK n=1 Tax=Aidingimonas halophila TaxID=574349 RepID=A0A1H3CH43_9GAMM|nr:polysaccharide pyruvyl transferase family protein [Aidingimonas halophila]SDX53425.1 Polysaccharide pyruvyl transferase family protein WcaK [Aidingimonas halophila]
MKICLVNDTSDDSNWGGKATSHALRALIDDTGGQVEATIYQYRLATPQPDDVSESDAFLSSGMASKDVAPLCWAAFDECATQVLNGEWFPSIYRELSECDVVLINGEGCIYDRTRQSRMIYFIAYFAKHCLDKPTAIVNHSIVLNDPVLMEIAVNVYPMLDDVVFREPDSALACPGAAGHVGADAAYIHLPRPVAAWNGTLGDGFDPERPYVCLGGGSVFFRGLRPGYDPLPGVMQLCERFRNDVGQVVLTASSHKDLSLMTPVSRELGLPLIDIGQSVQEAVDVLGHAGVYVGARWHPGIFAHRGGTPVVAWTEHTPKMTAFLKQAELSQRTFDPFRIGEQLDDIVSLAATYLDAGHELRDRLRVGAQRLAYKTRDNVRLLG